MMKDHILKRIAETQMYMTTSLVFFSLLSFTIYILYDGVAHYPYTHIISELHPYDTPCFSPMDPVCYVPTTPTLTQSSSTSTLSHSLYVGMEWFILLLLFTSSSLCSMMVVSLCMYKPYRDYLLRKEEEDILDYENYLKDKFPYEYKYVFDKGVYEEYMENYRKTQEEQEDHEETKSDTNTETESEQEPNQSHKHNYVCDTTPDGMVIMKYNHEREGFEYWSNKSIYYMYLEALARKYVTMFSCYEYYKSEPIFEEEEEGTDSEDEKENTDSEMVMDTEDENKDKDKDEHEDADLFLKCPAKKEVRKDEKIKNKYIHSGAITDFDILRKGEYKSDTNKLSFADFKRLFTL